MSQFTEFLYLACSIYIACTLNSHQIVDIFLQLKVSDSMGSYQTCKIMKTVDKLKLITATASELLISQHAASTRVKNLHGIPWNSMDFHGKFSMEFHGGLEHQFPWNSMEISP